MSRRKDGTICGARSKQDGHPCLNAPVPGRERCYVHGGHQPRGMARTTWKGSTRRADRLSQLLPKRLGERFDQAIRDPKLLELRADIALIDTRLEELLGQLDTGEAGAAWDRVQRAFTAYCITRSEVAFAELEAAIEAGASEQERWREVLLLVDNRRKLVESERRRQVEMQLMMTAEQAMNMFATIGEVIRRHVQDEETLKAIDADFHVLQNVRERADAAADD